MDTHPLFADFDAPALVRTIDKEGGASLPRFLDETVRLALLEELASREFVQQPTEYGAHGVRQSFSAVTAFPQGSLFTYVAEALQEYLQLTFICCEPNPLASRLHFTTTVVQRYPVGLGGITPHRDGKSFINLVALLVLDGTARFCFCDDRAGSNARSLRNEAGSLILMRAVGFLGADTQPFHFVDEVTQERTTFALRQRQNTKPQH